MKYLKHVTLFTICLLPIVFHSLVVSAGQITLSNGDVIHGELQAIHKDSLTWSSDIFGEITLPKKNVTQLSSSTVLPFKTLDTVKITQIDNGQNNYPLEAIKNCSIMMKSDVSALCDSEKLKGLSLNNIVTIKTIPEPPPFKGEMKFGYNQKSGNTDSEELDIAVSAQWRQQQFRHEADLIVESDTANGDVIDEQYKINYQLNYDFDDHWFSYGQVKYEKNRFSAIDEQYQVGMGLGHKLSLENQLQVNAQLGMAYLSTRRPGTDSESSSDNKDIAGRWALRLDWPIPGSKLTVFHRHELLWLMDEVDNTQLETSSGIKIPLLGGIFSEVRYDVDYVSEPASEQKHTDYEWVISVGYNW